MIKYNVKKSTPLSIIKVGIGIAMWLVWILTLPYLLEWDLDMGILLSFFWIALSWVIILHNSPLIEDESVPLPSIEGTGRFSMTITDKGDHYKVTITEANDDPP